MVTEGSLQMLSTLGGENLRGRNSVLQSRNFEDDIGKELEFILREQHTKEINDRERELNLYRSGSAPPTVEGSLTAVGGLFNHTNTEFSGIKKTSNGFFSEEEILSDPAHLWYYYSNSNLNPRLPPPTVSKDDRRVARRFQAGSSSFGGFDDRRKLDLVDDASSKSLFSLQPGLGNHKGESDLIERRKLSRRNLTRQPSAEWLERAADGLIGLSGAGLGARRKSLADIVQEDLGRANSVSGQFSCPASHNAFDEGMDQLGVTEEAQLAQLHNGVEALDGHRSGMTTPGLIRVQSFGSSTSHSFAQVLGSSLSRSTTPDPQLVRRSSSPCLPPVGGRVCAMDKKKVIGPNAYNGVSSSMAEHADIAAALSGLSLSTNRLVDEENHLQPRLQQEFGDHHNFLFNMPNGHSESQREQHIRNSETESLPVPTIPKLAYTDLRNNGVLNNFHVSKIASDVQVDLSKRTSTNLSSKIPPVGFAANSEGSIANYMNADIPNTEFSGYSSSGYSINQVPSMMNNQLGMGDLPLFNNGSAILNGSVEGQHLNKNRNQLSTGPQVPVMDHPLYVQYLQRTAEYAAQACLGPILAHQKSQYGVPFSSKSGGLNHGYYGSPAFGRGMLYPGSPIASSVLPYVGTGSAIRHSERVPHFPSAMRSLAGVAGSWHSENGGNMEENFGSSLLEEFKSNKTRCFELSEIVDHVVEFSADQYGSRFIQQKLEIATVEEKNMIFPEIIPHARSLMTDVFGNYVIQKFFEHGTESQRKELASQLSGHVLALSLQMYGCRVIQKALEVVDVDEQTRMVLELDGQVMRCVRDQNGNHVIQKCIECVPQERIQFIISAFYGQVVALSTHPYGCRVIQRVLEHCNDAKTQQIMIEEILQSVCTLAQDQYGNYVVQHVLQHGKPHERSAIIKKLAGQIVQMSQQKFASNVVEKCLTFGGPAERQLLVNEMLGTTDENEPLQAMMKDQFANYVVQKVLETCDDQHRELILSRIKVHLNALKRYTYGKHIVARVEKLITAGERHIGGSSPYLS